MVGGDAGSCGVCVGVLDVTLYAVVAGAADGYRSALHEEVLAAADAVACSCGHVNGGILDAEVLTRFDAVLHVSYNIERPLLGKLSVSLDVEAALLCTRGGINQCVGRACDGLYLDALTVLYVYGSTAIYGCGVGQCESVQFDGCLVGT